VGVCLRHIDRSLEQGGECISAAGRARRGVRNVG
jgi:hypothetical protein